MTSRLHNLKDFVLQKSTEVICQLKLTVIWFVISGSKISATKSFIQSFLVLIFIYSNEQFTLCLLHIGTILSGRTSNILAGVGITRGKKYCTAATVIDVLTEFAARAGIPIKHRRPYLLYLICRSHWATYEITPSNLFLKMKHLSSPVSLTAVLLTKGNLPKFTLQVPLTPEYILERVNLMNPTETQRHTQAQSRSKMSLRCKYNFELTWKMTVQAKTQFQRSFDLKVELRIKSKAYLIQQSSLNAPNPKSSSDLNWVQIQNYRVINIKTRIDPTLQCLAAESSHHKRQWCSTSHGHDLTNTVHRLQSRLHSKAVLPGRIFLSEDHLHFAKSNFTTVSDILDLRDWLSLCGKFCFDKVVCYQFKIITERSSTSESTPQCDSLGASGGTVRVLFALHRKDTSWW